MAAVLAVLSQISIPLPGGVPVTLQTFAVALCGYTLGPAFGTLAVGVYLSLGAVGMPVFAEFCGGIGILLGVTGGFLWSFLPMAFLCGLGIKTGKKFQALLLGIGGLAVCHLAGSVQFGLVAGTPFLTAFLTASAPFLVKDVVSLVLAYLAAVGVTASLKRAGLGDLA